MRPRSWHGLLLVVVVAFGFGCDRPLAVPTDAGPDAQSTVDLRGVMTSGDGCEAIVEDGKCDAQLGCHALRSGDKPCDEEKCNDHFVACLPGPAICTRPVSSDKCQSLVPICRTGDTLDYTDGICPGGCVARTKCPKADPGN